MLKVAESGKPISVKLAPSDANTIRMPIRLILKVEGGEIGEVHKNVDAVQSITGRHYHGRGLG